MDEPKPKDPIVALLEEVRDELKGHKRRWFQKTPWKEMLIHSSTVLFAGCVGWLAHAASGGAVNIEVAQSQQMKPAAVAAAPPLPSIEAPAEIEQEVVAVVPSSSSKPPPPKKNIEDNALAVVVIPRPPPPAAPRASASARPAPAAAAPAQAVDSF
jgi:hypothetical protein